MRVLRQTLLDTGSVMEIRGAVISECEVLSHLWYRAWHEAHASILPAEVVSDRTLSQFEDRITVALPTIRVAGPIDKPYGFCICKDSEVNQLFVTAEARGTGVAADLLQDAERCLWDAGIETGWLACAIGNERAARFYRKNGWRWSGPRMSNLHLTNRIFPLTVWCFEKCLMPPQNRSGELSLQRYPL